MTNTTGGGGPVYTGTTGTMARPAPPASVRMWRIPDSGRDGTEIIVRADSAAEAIAKCEAAALDSFARYVIEHPDAAGRTLEWYRGKPPLYDEIEEITDDVYHVPFYGYSW